MSRGIQTSRAAAPSGRRCERAVLTAYRELRETGTDDFSAFRACTTLYRIHHPESSASEARRLVAEWIDHHVTRQDAGPQNPRLENPGLENLNLQNSGPAAGCGCG